MIDHPQPTIRPPTTNGRCPVGDDDDYWMIEGNLVCFEAIEKPISSPHHPIIFTDSPLLDQARLAFLRPNPLFHHSPSDLAGLEQVNFPITSLSQFDTQK